jgi:hypothetical protein
MLLEEPHSVGLTYPRNSAGPVPHAAGAIRLASPLTSEAVRRAVAQPPAPHRYVNNVPVWMVLAARRVIEVYRGDVRHIWNDHPDGSRTAAALRRFRRHGAEESSDGRVDPSARSSGTHPRHARKQHRLRLHVRRSRIYNFRSCLHVP